MGKKMRWFALLLCLCLLAVYPAWAEEEQVVLLDEDVGLDMDEAPEEDAFVVEDTQYGLFEQSGNGEIVDAFPDLPNDQSDALPNSSYKYYYEVPITTYDAFREHVLKKEGGYDLDGKYGVQCWDGAALLWQQLGRVLETGGANARGCWTLEREANAGDEFAIIETKENIKRGDVVVFDWYKYGHICFADEDYPVGAEKIKVFGQNQKMVSFCQDEYPVDKIYGAFRYKGWAGIPIDADHFPDEVFRNYVSEYYDTDMNGLLRDAERDAVTYIDLGNMTGIRDLKGIKHFRKLEQLYCAGCNLTSLNLSDCKYLEELCCNNNKNLNSLNVKGCTSLYWINCSDCKLEKLELDDCKELDVLEADNNRLTALDTSKTKIWRLSCKNNGLKELTLNEECEDLQCNGNKLSRLDISNCERIVALWNYVKDGGDEVSSRTISSKAVIHYDSEHTMACLDFDAYTQLIVNGERVDGPKSLPTSVKLNKSGLTELKMTKTLQLKVTVKPAGSFPVVTWKSSDTKIAKVSSKGVVTPVKPGTVTIQVVTYNGLTAKARFKVVRVNPTKVTITNGAKATMPVGDTLQLKTKFTPKKSDSKLTWKSSNKKVATVSKDGVVTAKKKGEAIIAVMTANGKKDTIKITVTRKPVELSGYLYKDIKSFAKKFDLKLKSKVDFIEASEYGYSDYYIKTFTCKDSCVEAVGSEDADTKTAISKVKTSVISELTISGSGYKLCGVWVGMDKAAAKKALKAFAKKKFSSDQEEWEITDKKDYYEIWDMFGEVAGFKLKDGKVTEVYYFEPINYV